jgi:spore coat polysaccharide biosynthesis protein SpsF
VTSLVIALQARMGSSRLPGKVLEPIGRHSLLAHCIRRLQTADIGPVIVATTTMSADDAVVAEARRYGAQVFRGPSDDVLGRYVGVAEEFGGRYIVRATADNPAVDIDTSSRMIKAMLRSHAEYGIEHGLPYGAAVEIVAADTLRRLDTLTDDAEDREHVTLHIKRNMARFRTSASLAPIDLRRPELRLTVDTPDDLAFMRQVLEKVDDGPSPAPLTAIIAAADAVIRRSRAA